MSLIIYSSYYFLGYSDDHTHLQLTANWQYRPHQTNKENCKRRKSHVTTKRNYIRSISKKQRGKKLNCHLQCLAFPHVILSQCLSTKSSDEDNGIWYSTWQHRSSLLPVFQTTKGVVIKYFLKTSVSENMPLNISIGQWSSVTIQKDLS